MTMNLTTRQYSLLITAITVFYDEVAKTSTPELKAEIMELGQFISDSHAKTLEEKKYG